MTRRLLLPILFACGVWMLSAGAPSAQPPAKQGQKPDDKKKADEKKKADDKKKADQAKAKAAEPKPAESKPADPEPEETLDTTKPTNPLDLAHGLREQGLPDLAIEYLTILEAKKLPPDMKAVLPLELARARLDAIPLESEEGKRATMLALAKSEFDQFLKDQPKHLRAPEAALSLARVSAVLARNQLARAMGNENKDRRTAELAKARPVFVEAARRFTDAIKQITDQLATGKVEGARKVELTRDLHRAELEHGIVLFRSGDTYGAESTAGKKERGIALLAAKARFKALADRDNTHPVGWAARAWATECDYAIQNTAEADKQSAMIRTAVNTNPAAREGLRMNKFFEVQHKYESAQAPADLRSARELGERWLSEFKSPVQATPEQFSVQYYVAFLKFLEAKATGVRQDEKTKQVTVSPQAQRLLREAEKEFRSLANTDNEYADRAARQRTVAIRLIIGDAAKPPEAYPTFDECQMAALVQIDQGIRGEDAGEKTKKLAAAAALLERAVSLAGPTTTPRDKLDAEVQLAFAYLAGGQPAKAAALGEQVARSEKATSPCARAGALAVQAYLQLPTDADNANRDKALSLATFLEKTYPDAPSTDSA